MGSKTKEIKTQWEKLTIIARDPEIISTSRGLGICLQKGQTAEFKGVVARIGGDLKVENGNFRLSPLMVTEVSTNEEGSYVVCRST